MQFLFEIQGRKEVPETMEEPGKIIHEMQIDPDLVRERSKNVPWLKTGKNYFSVDSTPLFIILGTMMWERDRNFVLENGLSEPLIDAAKWIVDYGMNGTYLSFSKPQEGMGLQTQSWRDGSGAFLDSMVSPLSVIGVQGYAYFVFTKSIKMLKAAGLEQEYIDKMSTMAKTMKMNIVDDFKVPTSNFLALARDGNGELNQSITSDPGHLLFSGILEKDVEQNIVSRLMEPDILTDFGLRTLSVKDRDFDAYAYQKGSIWPQDNWIIAIGLKDRGYITEYREIKSRLLFLSDTVQGLPEYIGVTESGQIINAEKMKVIPCYPQSWSTGAEIFFRTH